MTNDSGTQPGRGDGHSDGGRSEAGKGAAWWWAAAVGGLALVFAVILAARSGPRTPVSTGSETAEAAEAPVQRPISAAAEALDRILTTAQDQEAAGQRARATAILREGIETYPGDRELRLAYAELLARGGDAEGAYEQLAAAIELGVDDAETLLSAGVMASAMGRDDLAVERLFEAQTKAPNNAEIALRLGVAQLRAGDLPAAQASLVRSGTLDPERAIVWGTLAEVSLRQNQPMLAAQHAGKARAIEPQELSWRVIEARALKRGGQPAEALDLLVGLRDEDRFRPPVLRLIGECLGLLGRPDEAAALYAAASERSPRDAELAREAAIWIDRVGDEAGARIFAERAAAMGDETAAELLKRLGG